MTVEDIILELEKIGVVKFGKFILKSGIESPFYIDLREMISHPQLLNAVSQQLVNRIRRLEFDVITGIPYTALPIAALVADKLKKPLIFMRKEEKSYGTGKNVIGKFKEGDRCLVIDDLITTGESKIEAAEALEKEGLRITDFMVVVDRSSSGAEDLKTAGYKLHSLFTLDKMLEILQDNFMISRCVARDVREFTHNLNTPISKEIKGPVNPLTLKLKDLINRKRSNLVLSLDVENKKDFFRILDEIGREIVLLKTHVDIIEDFDRSFLEQLQTVAKEKEFILFEDRKFADIGNTVRKQYRSGIYHIADWAEFVTVHLVPGEGIIKGLFDGLKARSSFILARMSSQGNLINETYTRRCFEIASRYPEVISGFIGHGTSVDDIKRFKAKFPPGMLLLTPGVKLEKGADNMGQQYITVEEAIRGGADCIIVGRGIYEAKDPVGVARIYRERAWKEYEKNTQEMK